MYWAHATNCNEVWYVWVFPQVGPVWSSRFLLTNITHSPPEEKVLRSMSRREGSIISISQKMSAHKFNSCLSTVYLRSSPCFCSSLFEDAHSLFPAPKLFFKMLYFHLAPDLPAHYIFRPVLCLEEFETSEPLGKYILHI